MPDETRMTQDIILANIQQKQYEPTVPYPSYDDYPVFNKNYIFDLNKSINWNREQVTKHKQARKNALQQYEAAKYLAETRFRTDLQQMCVYTYELNSAIAQAIIDEVMSQKIADWKPELVNRVADLAEFVQKILKLQQS